MQILEVLSAPVNFTKLLMPCLKPHGQSFQSITVQCLERQILCICVVQALYTLDKKSPSKINFRTFECLGENSPNFSCHIWNHHSSLSWEVTLRYFFSWNFKWFGQKESIKELNFRFLTAHVKLHQICTLMCSFCWKYIKFQLKMYRGVLPHGTEEWCKIWKETDLLL